MITGHCSFALFASYSLQNLAAVWVGGLLLAIDSRRTERYSVGVKNNSSHKKPASTKHVVRLARKMKWRDVKLPSGEVVSAESTRQIFEDAAKALKSEPRRKRAHAAA